MRWIMAAALLAAPMGAAGQDRVTIELANFKFRPEAIRLHHGHHYVLHFVNAASGGHDFVAKSFFAAATLDKPGSVTDGKIELGGGESTDIALTAPAPGQYPAHCSHFMHSAMGMTGSITVD